MLDSTANFVQVQASTGYSSSATSITLQSSQGAKLPAAPFNLIWWDSTDYPNPADDPTVEIVRVPTHALQSKATDFGYIGSSGEQRVRELARNAPGIPDELRNKIEKRRNGRYEEFRYMSRSAAMVRLFDDGAPAEQIFAL